MSTALALVESPAQVLNVVEWAYATGADPLIMHLGPVGATTRFQMHRVAEISGAAGFRHQWAEVRVGPGRGIELAKVAPKVRAADVLVLGDPCSGLSQVLLNVARDPRIVVVDDGTSTIRYAQQWAHRAPLVRWDKPQVPKANLLVGRTAFRRLGNRSDRVELFTAMPIQMPGLPQTPNAYAWVKHMWPSPEVLPGTDLMGTSLVESGIVAEEPYLQGIAKLVRERGVARYLPHRKESNGKLRTIEAMGVRLVRPDLPMEMHARIGPIGSTILSFPSTVVHTLPLVLEGSGVRLEALSVEDDWFNEGAEEAARDFVREINRPG